MRRHDRPLLILGFVMFTLGVVMGLICAAYVWMTNPIIGTIMATITLSPLLVVLVFWLFVLEHRGRK